MNFFFNYQIGSGYGASYAPPPTQTKRGKKYQARGPSSKVKHANNKASKYVAKQVEANEVLEEATMLEVGSDGGSKWE
jgi:hypothetical protein